MATQHADTAATMIEIEPARLAEYTRAARSSAVALPAATWNAIAEDASELGGEVPSV